MNSALQIGAILGKIGDIPVEQQVDTLLASCEYEPPRTNDKVDVDKDHMDLMLKVEMEKSQKMEKQKERT